MKHLLAVLAILAIIAGFLVGKGHHAPAEPSAAETIRIVETDTVTIIRPEVRVLRLKDTIELRINRSDVTADSLSDSVTATLFREAKVYADSNFRAVVSGIAVSLDSLTILPRKETTIIRSISKQEKWVVGPSVGLMWNGRNLNPAIGVSLTYRFAGF